MDVRLEARHAGVVISAVPFAHQTGCPTRPRLGRGTLHALRQCHEGTVGCDLRLVKGSR
jgi:hypothetical protein